MDEKNIDDYVNRQFGGGGNMESLRPFAKGFSQILIIFTEEGLSRQEAYDLTKSIMLPNLLSNLHGPKKED